MSDTQASVEEEVAQKSVAALKVRKPSVKRRVSTKSTKSTVDTVSFNEFIARLEIDPIPTLHINGAAYPNCVLTLDFGQPLVRVEKLTTEQSGELVNRIRQLTKDVMGREVSVRVSNDGQTGIYWTTIS